MDNKNKLKLINKLINTPFKFLTQYLCAIDGCLNCKHDKQIGIECMMILEGERSLDKSLTNLYSEKVTNG